jgi:hypothetical protein
LALSAENFIARSTHPTLTGSLFCASLEWKRSSVACWSAYVEKFGCSARYYLSRQFGTAMICTMMICAAMA